MVFVPPGGPAVITVTSTFLRAEVRGKWGFPVALVVKDPPASAGDLRTAGPIPGLGRFPGEGSGDPCQYSCLENPMDRGAWQVTAHEVAKELDIAEAS